MKKVLLLAITFLGVNTYSMAASNTDSTCKESPVVLHTPTGDLFGTYTIPIITSTSTKLPVALIIAGSGPTDRDGNNPMAKCANLQKLAYSLSNNHIASLRFDKRGIASSASASKKEEDGKFDDHISDVKEWITLLKKDNRFSKIIVIGHSEGSLIGMAGSLNLADEFVSIAGPGRSIDKVLKEQLASQPQSIKDKCFPILDSLVAGKTVKNVNPLLYSLFRPSVQPYLISWIKYDPQVEIKKLTIPVLIIQGTNDIQVSVNDAKLLAKAKPSAKLVLIKNMNHIFRTLESTDKAANAATYNDASLPISDELVTTITSFINQ